MSAFRRAERKAAKLRACLCGTAGSGKTYSALLIAKGLGGRVAVIDTERGSAELYSDLMEYDAAQLAPPFEPKRYIELIKAAAAAYDVLIIDSLSHAWAGEGGVLEMHDKATLAGSKNSYTAWRDVTPQHNALVDALLNAPCHVIATMRSKTAYDLVENDKGKKVPVKIGMAPIQRDGMEYEFTIVWDVSVSGHVASASKDRTRLWDARNAVITESHGLELKKWLESGASASPIEVYDTDAADAMIASFEDEAAMKQWLKDERIRMGWKPGDAAYEALKAACAERAKVINSKRPPLNPAPGLPATPESLEAVGFARTPMPFDDALDAIADPLEAAL